MKKRVLLPPATRSPKLEAIRAAVEEVAAEKERPSDKKKARQKPPAKALGKSRHRPRRAILEPVVRSPRRDAIEAAVDKVLARKAVDGRDAKG